MTAAIMIQLITGAIGSVGFGILFHIKKKYLPLAAVGGFLSWLVFLLGKEFWGNVFLPTLMAGLLVLLQMCMRKFLQESVKKHLHLFLLLP